MTTIYQAHVESYRFTFEAYGTTPAQAKNQLIAALCRHGRQLKIPENWFGDMLADVVVREITTGVAYRDREVI